MRQTPTDLALVGGAVMTMADGAAIAEGLAIRDNRIVAVGTTSEIRQVIGPDTTVIELAGKTVLPGLIDCHTHLATDAKDGLSVELRDFYIEIDSIQSLLERFEQAARGSADGTWIVGRAGPMQDRRLAERRFPTRRELDTAAGKHPAYITFGSHVLIANTAALETLGIDSRTSNPRNGLVMKDPQTGEPTGEFRDGAGALFTMGKHLPAPALANLIETDLRRCAERGVTCIHDVVASSNEIQAYQELHDAKRLPARVRLLIRVVHSDFPNDSVRELGLRQGFGDDMLALGGVKCSVDGGFTGRTAAFAEPLVGEDRGTIRISAAELHEVVRSHHNAGVRVCVHAIGDRALDMTLETFDNAIRARPEIRLRHRVEHMGNWMCTADRMAKAKSAGLSLVPNPAMMHYLGDEIESALGSERARDAFPFRAIRDIGLPFGFGSDGPGLWPSDPLRDIGTAVCRTTRSHRLMGAMQALTFTEALEAQTTTAAWLGYDETTLGSLRPGKLADLVVVGEDPLSMAPDHIQHMTVETTIVGGKIVFQRGA